MPWCSLVKILWEKLAFWYRKTWQSIIEKFPELPFGFFNADQNQAGKLQTRIDRGIGSLTRLGTNLFIDILPLFSSAIVALGLMYYANFYVGLVAPVLSQFTFG